MTKNIKAFTLIELLVVVLILGILAAIALPQYQLAVEKSRAAEAFTILRAIADANHRYYLENGVYAKEDDMDKLDISIPKTYINNMSPHRIATNNFIYSCGSLEDDSNKIAIAQRADEGKTKQEYYIYMKANEYPNKFRCWAYTQSSTVSKKICAQINAKGTL